MSDEVVKKLVRRRFVPTTKPVAMEPGNVTLRCPHCGSMGSFLPLEKIHDVKYSIGQRFVGTNRDEYVLGLRRCPDDQCAGLIAISASREFMKLVVVESFPPSRIEFKNTDIPAPIVASMNEAIACHSVGAYRSSALMVRRTLELLCQAKETRGDNLKERLANLSEHAILPQGFLRAADQLRLLGNDAAHVEAHVYDDIDKAHSETAIEVAKEILKAVYQHEHLMDRLNKLKKPVDPS